jgi:enoyl-CoA hydratase/carnithine racemase
MPDLEYERNGHVATITLNRTGRKNAFTIEMIDAWVGALRDAQADDVVRAIVVTGSGGAFCSGVDLDLYQQHVGNPVSLKILLTAHIHQVALAMEQIDKPVIAAVTGVAVGAGLDMALLCDYRIAVGTATLSEGYIRIGALPGDGGCWLLPRIVGQSRALHLLWTGDLLSAEDALRLGIVDEVVDDADAAAQDLAEVLAQRSPLAVRAIKRAVRQGARHDLPTALDLISSHFAALTGSSDSAEALSAFRRGRNAEFVGA